MNESNLETGILELQQAEGIIPIENQVLNRDLPASQQYNCLTEAEERQADEHIAAWEKHNAPWTLGSYLKSLRQSIQTSSASDYSSTSSSTQTDGHYGQYSDSGSRVIAAGTGQMPASNGKQRKVPKFIPTSPAKHHAANSHPERIGTGATYKLPTGEVVTEQQEARRLHFVGFPPITQPLPKEIEDEDIIKHWPNHLWGPLLLRVAEKWKPIEISQTTPVDLGNNAIAKRLAAARIQGGEELPKTRLRKRKPPARERKFLDEQEVSPQPETELEDSQALRMDKNREMYSENLRQSERLRKRRKSAK